MTRRNQAAILAITAVLAAGCGSAAGQVTVNGAADAPVTITATSYSVTGRSGGDQLVKFTELASKLSNGSIAMTAGPEPDSSRPDTSAEAIAMAQDGRVQLAVVSARTFDTLGVTSFQALQAPYLVTSNELADKILADPVAATMLDGTEPLGLVGLGLAYDFLAYPGGFGQPVLTPEDYAGKAFQVRPSRANDLLVQALGGTPDPRNGPDLEQAVADNEVRGSWEKFDGPTQPVTGEIFTANEPAFLRANVIVMNAKVFGGLSAAQQQALRTAAAQTREWMATRHQDPATLAAAYCSDSGGTIVIATPDQLAAMKAATEPVVATLAEQDVTRTVIARIRELARDVTPPATPAPCEPDNHSVAIPELAADTDQSAINGVWRLDVDAGVLLAAGLSELDAGNNAGTWTFTLTDGEATYTEPRGRVCRMTYVLGGNHFLGIGREPGCNNVLPLVVVRSGDQLQMTPWPGTSTGVPLTGDDEGRMVPDPAGFAAAFFHHPFIRLGDAN